MSEASARIRLPKAAYWMILSTDIALCILGLAVWQQVFPADTPVLATLPPLAGLFIAVLAGASAASVWFLFGRSRRDPRQNRTVQ